MREGGIERDDGRSGSVARNKLLLRMAALLFLFRVRKGRNESHADLAAFADRMAFRVIRSMVRYPRSVTSRNAQSAPGWSDSSDIPVGPGSMHVDITKACVTESHGKIFLRCDSQIPEGDTGGSQVLTGD